MRRTFLISHPRRQTTLTEQCCVGGAIRWRSGQARGEARRARSDWRDRQARGISFRPACDAVRVRRHGVQSARHAVPLTFLRGYLPYPYGPFPVYGSSGEGHRSPDAEMFEVSRLRDIPIITLSQYDGRRAYPFELVDEIAVSSSRMRADELAGGFGAHFHGVRDSENASCRLRGERKAEGVPDDSRANLTKSRLVRHGRHRSSWHLSRGHMTPVYFGSALKGLACQSVAAIATPRAAAAPQAARPAPSSRPKIRPRFVFNVRRT